LKVKAGHFQNDRATKDRTTESEDLKRGKEKTRHAAGSREVR
jgi:hypothetical protein